MEGAYVRGGESELSISPRTPFKSCRASTRQRREIRFVAKLHSAGGFMRTRSVHN